MTARGWVVGVEIHATRVELDRHGLALAVGERVIVESREGDVSQATVIEPDLVEVPGAAGYVGQRVRVRRPR